MGADFSRIRINPLLDYAGVELKQGGVLLDADVNELVAIVDRRLRALASDVLGRATVSSTTPDAFKITVSGGVAARSARAGSTSTACSPRITAPPRTIPPSGCSIRCWPSGSSPIRSPTPRSPICPNPPALPTAGRHLVYLDVWNREVTHLEQPDLVESAVGVETSSRMQTVWQVRVLAQDAGTGHLRLAGRRRPRLGRRSSRPRPGVLTTGTFEVAAGRRSVRAAADRRLSRAREPALPRRDPRSRPAGRHRHLQVVARERQRRQPRRQHGLGRRARARRRSAATTCCASTPATGSRSSTTCASSRSASGEMRQITVNEATRRIAVHAGAAGAMLPGSFPDSAFPAARNLRVRRWDQTRRGLPHRRQRHAGPGAGSRRRGSTGVIAVPAAGTTLLARERRHGLASPRPAPRVSSRATTGCSPRAPPTPRSSCSIARRRAASTTTTRGSASGTSARAR